MVETRPYRFQVHGRQLDMESSISEIIRLCFPAAKQVIARSHVQNLAFAAVQEMRSSFQSD
ncbi:MAG TPA: transposase [Parabacteroides johnsonii]|nr:transposase [Parabacteroides johnsonii]UEA92524.1 transposase [Parabacteroides johnsonii]HJG99077.1 transposase [Parabacteroides johnsonii]